MDINLKYDPSFDRKLLTTELNMLLKLIRDPFEINFDKDIKIPILENNLKKGEEGWIYYEFKDRKFLKFFSSKFNQSDYEQIARDIEESGNNIEQLEDHTMCTVFLDRETDADKMVHPVIKENLKDLIEYIKHTNIHIEAVYFNIGPKGVVPPHSDGESHKEYYTAIVNLNCPVDGVTIIVDNITSTIFPEDLFLFNSKKIHYVRNPSESEDWEFIAFRLKSNI